MIVIFFSIEPPFHCPIPHYLLRIVLGFFRDSFSGIEQGPGHSVQVGYQKGAQVFRQNLVFRVLSTQGTASEFGEHLFFSD